MAPAVIAAINMQKVLSEYNRYKESSEKFEADSMQKRKELELLLAEARDHAEKRESFGVGTPDYQAFSDKLADTQAKFEAQKQKIAADFAIRESNAVAEIYNDVRYIVEYISKQKNISLVMQVGSSDKLTGENPDLVMSTVLQPVVYHDPSIDITDQVISTLNAFHERRKAQQGGAAPSAAPATAPAPASADPSPAAGGN